MQLKSLQSWLIVPALLAGVVSAGCERTEYVYLDSNGRPVSDDVRGTVQITGWREETPGNWRGQWAGQLQDVKPGERMTLYAVFRETSPERSTSRTYTLETATDPWNSTTGEGVIHRTIRHDAGTFTFDGSHKGANASGTAQFASDPTYAVEIAKIFSPSQPVAADSIANPLLALEQLELDDVRAFHFANPKYVFDDIARLHRSGVDPEYVASYVKANYDLSADDLVRLRNSGVDAAYAAGMKTGGLSLDAGQLIRLRNSGVDAPYASAIFHAGLGNDIGDIIALRNSGVGADFGQSFNDAGYHFGKDDLIRLRNSGITSAFASDLRKGGYDLDAAALIRLRNSGVDPAYAVGIKKAGYALDIADIIRLRNSGVDVAYMTALVAPGRKNIGVPEIISLRNKGLDAETVRKLRE